MSLRRENTFAGGWLIDRQGVGAIGLAPIGFAVLAVPLAFLIGRSVAREAPRRPAFAPDYK